MQIYNIYSVNFIGNYPVNTKGVNSKKVVNNLYKTNSVVQKKLYNDIELYLNSNISKEKYLENFMSNIDNKVYKKLNNVEKKYVHDILTVTDISESYKSITDEFIQEKIQKLLDARNINNKK